VCESDELRPEQHPLEWLRYLDSDRRVPVGSTARPMILICIDVQRLYWWDHHGLPTAYAVSTAARGFGNRADSAQTPTGLHRVAERIGQGSPDRTVFRGRKAMGVAGGAMEARGREIKVPGVRNDTPGLTELHLDDPITSRILWLEGLEPGINRGEGCDTYRRYIYIHGTLDEAGVGGPPSSHGCIRMRNDDVIDLFARTPLHTPVLILATCIFVPAGA
jgi:lipoprotein-anchoring transpeptidase ErfK/SrfK